MSVAFDNGVFLSASALTPGVAYIYATNDTTNSPAERKYLQTLQDLAAKQDLSEDSRSYVRAITISFTAFAAAIVALRFLSRRLQAAKILIDDYLMLASLALLVGNMIMNLILVDHGIGLHTGVLPLANIQFLNRTMLGAEILYCSAVSLYKIALLFLYFRIFPLPEVRKWGRICGFIVAGWTGAVWVAASIQCLPLAKLWEPWKEGWCINLFLTQLAIAVPCIILDIAILCLPIPHVLRLQMNRTQKILVMVVFLLGSYVVFTSAYRFRVFLEYTHDDSSFTLAGGLSWNIIEVSSGIVSACLPTLAPVLRFVFKNIMHSAALSYARRGRGTLSSHNKLTGVGNNTDTGKTGTQKSVGAHERYASKQWAQGADGFAVPATANAAHGLQASSRREDQKYGGIGLTTIMRDDDSRSSDDIELVRHQDGPATPTLPLPLPPSPRSILSYHQHLVEGRRESSGGDVALAMGTHTVVKSDGMGHDPEQRDGEGAASDRSMTTGTRIWQNRTVEVTIEEAAPPSQQRESQGG